MSEALTLLVALIFIIFASISEAKTVRATDLNAQTMSEILKGKDQDFNIEFREGDVLPVNFQSEGDLFVTTTKPTPSLVTVKRNFWIRIQSEALEISFDGTNYKNIKDALTGGVSAGFNQSGGVANIINVAFQAYLK